MTDWLPAGEDLKQVLATLEDPLQALSRAEIPAIVLRRACTADQCAALLNRFVERGLMPSAEEIARTERRRVDIGTSLANFGNDRDEFLDRSAESTELFQTLFDGVENPVTLIYDALATLAESESKRVIIAHEPDGRHYCPAIVRIHYNGHRYRPHIDHVTLREKRFDYAVTRFDHQFAGVFCLQNSIPRKLVPQAILHRCLWTGEVQPHIEAETFGEYKAARKIEDYRVDLEEGDLYFFNTRCIHEVPAVEGDRARVVVAVFIGYSEDDEEIFVWS